MSSKPPRLGRWILRWIYDGEHFDEIAGDLEEMYQDQVQSRGRLIASTLYLKDAILSLQNLQLFRFNPGMISNLVVIAFRSLKRRLSYSIPNILHRWESSG